MPADASKFTKMIREGSDASELGVNEGARAMRGSALRVVGYGVASLLGVVSAAIIFRGLGVDQTGHYITVLAIFALAGSLADGGLANIAVRDVALLPLSERLGYMRTMMGLRLVTGAVGAIAALAFMTFADYSMLLIGAGIFAAICLVLQVAQQTAVAPLVADLRIRPVIAFDLARQVVQVGLIVAAFELGSGIVGYVAIAVPALIVALAATFAVTRGQVPIAFTIDLRAWWKMLRPVLPLAFALGILAMYFRAAMVVTSLVASEREVGLFGASFRVTEVVIGLPILAAGTALPFLARSAAVERARFRLDLGTAVQTAIVAGLGVALTLFVGAPTVIQVIAGPVFSDAVPVLRLQSISLALVFITSALGIGLTIVHAYRPLLLAGLAGLAVNIFAVVVLADVLGARGSAIATALAEAVLMCAMYVGLRLSDAAPAVSLLRSIGAVAVSGTLGLVIMAPFVPNIVLLVLVPIIYVGVTWIFGIIPDPVRIEVRRFIVRGTAA